jgi:putative membrane protein
MLKKIWKNEKKDRKLELIGLLGVVSGFLLLTLPTLAKASIWFDEAFSAYLIRYDFAKIWHLTSVDVHPPLYYFALKIWSLIFGTSDFGLRSLSVFFGVLTLIFAFYLIKRIFKSTKTALLSMVMLAISPMFVRYSQEIRMYMMVAFLSILTVRAFYEIYLAKNS